MLDSLPFLVKGHVRIEDDIGNVLVNKPNAIHPQNMARVLARALAHENNHWIHRVAFGNGGTQVDAAFTVTYNTPNDGQPPDVRTWDSRLYNETYSEIVDDSSALLGTDPGSAGPNSGSRPGGGSVPTSDPTSIAHISGPGVRSSELGLTSEVIVTAVINPDEPMGQSSLDNQWPSGNTENSFTFDEIGLYTSGAPAINSAGSADVYVGERTSRDNTGLLANTYYSFIVNIDGGGATQVDFRTPAIGGSGAGGTILYGDLCEAINTGDATWNPAWAGANPLPGNASMSITDDTLNFPSIAGAQTYGHLRIISGTTGETSTVVLSQHVSGMTVTYPDGPFPSLDMWSSLNQPSGGVLLTPVAGSVAGVQNNPVSPTTERERLLTHVTFSPILKAKNRVLTLTYTLTISVARTE